MAVKTKSMTEEEALRYAGSLGLGRDSFSDADWGLYQTDADRFSSIADYKRAYGNASSDEERNRIHTATERLRKEVGYSGGKDGRGYFMTTASPGSFSYEDRPQFSYDPENDEVYKAYRNRYMREGQRAAENAIGSAAAATGGRPSSYAATAAAQAGGYYGAQLSDKIPELYDAAYSRYRDQQNRYDSDRAFAYRQHMDTVSHNDDMYSRDWNEAAQMAAAGDYSGYKGLGMNTENNPVIQSMNDAQRKQAEADRGYSLQLAKMALESGDYGAVYDLLGITVNKSDITSKEKLQAALFKAQLGDYSWLDQMMAGYF